MKKIYLTMLFVSTSMFADNEQKQSLENFQEIDVQISNNDECCEKSEILKDYLSAIGASWATAVEQSNNFYRECIQIKKITKLE